MGFNNDRNYEQGENAVKKCILAESGECEAENKFATKSSAHEPIKFLRLCFSYIDHLNGTMNWVHFITVIPGTVAVATTLLVF